MAGFLLALASIGSVIAEDKSCNDLFANQTLVGQFEATIQEGPDTGLSITGRIRMRVDESGDFAGTLTLTDGTEVPFVGAFHGREIRYHFDLGNGATILGTGVLPTPCTDSVTGPALGSNPPDRGDWGIIWGS